MWSLLLVAFFFFNDTATTEIYTLSLHDALPISILSGSAGPGARSCVAAVRAGLRCAGAAFPRRSARVPRSEEHTSELQSQSNLVCRLLLEKKKIPIPLRDLSHREYGLRLDVAAA